MATKNKSLALIFTRNISLKRWVDSGTISREIRVYGILEKYFKQICFFTYDETYIKESFQKHLGKIKLFPKNSRLPSLVYSLLMPFMYKKELSNIDIIKTNQMDGAWAAVIAKKLTHSKLVVRCGYQLYDFGVGEKFPWWKLQIIKVVERFVYQNADRIVVTTWADKANIINRYKVSDNTVAVVPNYIDTDLFIPNGKIVKKNNRLCYVGRLSSEKNIESLIDAVDGLDIELIIIGDGSLKEKLISHAQQIKKAKITFRGVVNNELLPTELVRSSIFVFPSLHEGCPKSLLEAMSCGVACIGSDVVGINNIIVPEKNGLLCHPTTEGIREKITMLIKDPDLVVKLGVGARTTILENYSLGNVVKLEMKIYNEFSND